jgi:hypothetical protein
LTLLIVSQANAQPVDPPPGDPPPPQPPPAQPPPPQPPPDQTQPPPAQPPPAQPPPAGDAAQPAQPAGDAAAAAKEEPKWYDSFKIDAFADGYVGINFNFPRPQGPSGNGAGGNSFRAYDVNNGFTLHWIGLNLGYAPDPVGGTIGLRFGPSATIYGGPDNEHGLENVKQAFLTLKPGGADGQFTLDFGKFDTIVGAEVADSQFNMNYTRGVLYWYAQPLFHTGFKAEYAFVPEFAARAMLVNGYNNTVDNNAGKTGGVQLVIKPTDKFAAYLGYLFGPEQADTTTLECPEGTTISGEACVDDPDGEGGTVDIDVDGVNGNFKHLGDLVVDINPVDIFRILLNGNFGAEELATPGDQFVLYYGGSLAMRVAAHEIFGIGVRGEVYRDEDGYTTGVGSAINFYTGTLTFDLKPVKYLTTMLDFRVDGASEDVFQTKLTKANPYQITATLGAIVKTE